MIPHKYVIQHTQLDRFVFTSAGAKGEPVDFPVGIDFFVEDCVAYRKIRFKVDPAHVQRGDGQEVSIGGRRQKVDFVDVRESLREIFFTKQNPTRPYAWWASDWEEQEKNTFFRKLYVLGKPWGATIELPQISTSNCSVKEVLRTVDENIAGINFVQGVPPSVRVLVRGKNNVFPVQVKFKRGRQVSTGG